MCPTAFFFPLWYICSRPFWTKQCLLHKWHVYVLIKFLTSKLCSHRDTPVFCALINGEGEVVDFLRLPYFMKRRNAFREDEREKKVQAECSRQIILCYRKNMLLDASLRHSCVSSSGPWHWKSQEVSDRQETSCGSCRRGKQVNSWFLTQCDGILRGSILNSIHKL